MKTFVVWGEGLRKRAGRREPKWLGDIEAETLEEAQSTAAEKWPGIKLNVSEQRMTNHSTPKTGCPERPE